ncbi:AcrR family transcriptional regulator [Natronocella acetinitrilica]|uniref:AcrR family transcriptional regulator n=1 Tax=Natronocella acetinitrilica TaxID=414046 RepID=A0AAE3KDI3_9GAMM|nr:TetR/AcrR family transcriptional regulator [Natronocella acetinitrilica]MCP1676338.1 AcrR family transcriptional regulator [Natronocella acetinitrilica]
MDNQTMSRRDQLLETATELFYRNGCHTTGIDRVLAEAGVAKMTLYKHFKSKENLVLAAADRINQRLREEFEAAVEREGLTARERLLRIFEFMEEWGRREDFCGCPSINLAVQYPEADHPVHCAAADHKRARIASITELARQAGAPRPESLGEQLVLLIEGATVMVQVTGDRSLIRRAGEAARTLIEAQLGVEP